MRLRLICLAAVFITGTQQSHSLPRFALMAGAKCSSCHVNPTGGQMRTEYGLAFSTDKVPIEAWRDSDFTFSGKVSDNISIGGEYRSQFIYDGLSKTTAFQAMTTSVYGAATIGKKIVFYFKQDLINGTYNGLSNGTDPFNGTEAFVLARILPSGGYIKGGSFMPNYGWRIDDHTSYTRGGDLGYTGAGSQAGLLFVPNYKDIGVEVGAYIENLFVTAGLFNGTGHRYPIDFSDKKAYAVKVEYSGGISSLNFILGASAYGFRAFSMGGVSAGFGTGDVTILGEIDWTKNYMVGPANPGGNLSAAFAEIDFRAIQGVWIIGKFDMVDPVEGVADDDASPFTNTVKRLTLGFEIFPFSFVDLRPQYRIVMETPGISNDVALVQMHAWF